MMRVVHDEPRTYGRISIEFGLYGDRSPIQAQHSQYQFLPNLLTVEYRMNRVGVWLEDAWTVYGWRVLASGKESRKTRLKLDGYFGRMLDADIPDWVKGVAEKYRPGNTRPTTASSDTTLIY